MSVGRRKIIAVIGDSACSNEVEAKAYEVGALIARHGMTLICGGYGGVMSAASKGAKDAGGLTIGVLSGKDKIGMNDSIDIPIVTGMGEARNAVIIRSSDGVIAVGGGYGTLSEIGFALKASIPLVGINTWILGHPDALKAPSFPTTDTPSEACRILFSTL